MQRRFAHKDAQTPAGKNILPELRQEMLGEIPQQTCEVTVTRFSLKTVVIAIIGVVALWAVLGSLNFETIVEAVQTLTAGGSSQHSFWVWSPTGVRRRAFLLRSRKAQRSRNDARPGGASVVALVAPAGVGPAALNLRYLNKRGVSTPIAVATVALVQFTQFTTTVVTA